MREGLEDGWLKGQNDGQMVGWRFGQVGSEGCTDGWIDDCVPLGRIPGPIGLLLPPSLGQLMKAAGPGLET